MAINFPTSLDVFTDPTASDQLNLPSHSGQHTDLNNAVEALEAKVGINSSAVTSSHDYKIAQLEAAATGKILQVVSTTKTDTYTNATGSFADVTGLSVSITPSATSSKVLVLVALQLTSDTGIIAASRLLRGATPIFIGDTAGSRTTAATASRAAASLEQFGHSIVHLDSPATTSALTYKVQAVGLSGTAYVNRTYLDTDSSGIVRSASSITALEVSA